MALNKDWKDLPASLAPAVGETVKDWHDRIDAYALANPTGASALTPLSAVALEDLEARALEQAELAATTSAKGVVQLAGDLGGTATAPTVLARVTALPTATEALRGKLYLLLGTDDTEDTLHVCERSGSVYVFSEISLGGTAAQPAASVIHTIGAAGEAVAFGSGWQAAPGHQPPQYWLSEDGEAHIGGYVQATADKAATSPIATVPAGFRSAGRVESLERPSVGLVAVDSAGQISWEYPPYPLENTFDGFAAAAIPTAATSGGESGDPFTDVTAASIMTVETDQLTAGLRRMAKVAQGVTAVPAHVSWTAKPLLARSHGRVYCRWSAFGAGTAQRIVRFFNGVNAICGIALRTDLASPVLRIVAGADGNTFEAEVGSTVFAVNTWYRIAWDFTFHATAARLEVKVFAGANVNGASADETLLLTGRNTRSLAAADGVTIGCASGGVPSSNFWFGGIDMNDKRYPGPYGSKTRKTLASGSIVPLLFAYQAGGPPAISPTPPNDFMLLSAAEITALPASGSAYTYMKARADDAIAQMTFGTPASTSPLLVNRSDQYATAVMACAFVYLKTGTVAYKDHVTTACRYLIGTETLATATDSTASVDFLLAAMRQLTGYILAADMVGMSPGVLGSRTGWTTKAWDTWLGELRTKVIGSSSNKNRTDVLNNQHATNWGAWASSSRIAIDIYIGDYADLAIAVERLKYYLRESLTGSGWITSNSFDSTWAYVPTGESVAFWGVNPVPPGEAGIYTGKNGLIPEDASRSAGAYPTFDATGLDYTFHALGAQIIATAMLEREGYSGVWTWGNSALARVMARLNAEGVSAGNGRSTAKWVVHAANHYFGTSYAEVALTETNIADLGHSLYFTDWLWA